MTVTTRLLMATTMLAAGVGTAATAHAAAMYSLVTTIPINQGLAKFSGYDNSTVDPLTQLYYLTDRSASAIDVISTKTNTLIERIGQTAGFGGVSTSNDTAGPNGISVTTLADGSKLLLAGNTAPNSTVGNVIAFNLASDGLTVNMTRTLTTANALTPTPANRVDGVVYSPIANSILAANNASTPGVITTLSNADGHIINTLLLNGTGGVPNGQGNGVEGPIFDTLTKTFFVAIPNLTSDATGAGTGGGGVVEIDPTTGALLRTFSFDALGAPGACNPNGVVQGAGGVIGVACGTSGTTSARGLTLFLDPAANSGKGSITTSDAVSGADQIAFDPTTGVYFEAARFALPSGEADATPLLGIFNSDGSFSQSIPITFNDHSVAVDPVTHEVLVAFGASPKSPSPSAFPGCSLGCVAVFAPATAVPEPTSIALMMTGLIGAAGAVGRRHRRG